MSKIIWLASLAMLTAAGCSQSNDTQSATPPRPIKMLELQQGGIVPTFEFSGRILANRQANIGFEVPGVMTAIHVAEGEKVKAGDLLAELDSRDYAAREQAAAAQLETARLEAERAEALFERQATSKQRRDMAISNLQVAQSVYEQAAKALEDTKITAPFDGTISQILVEDVVNVQPKQTILILQDLSVLKVETDVPETMGAIAKPNMSLAKRNAMMRPFVKLSFLPDRLFSAKLHEVAMMADPATRTYTATFTFATPEDVLVLPGMTASILVTPVSAEVASNNSVFAVPTRLVTVTTNQAPFVWRVDPVSTVVEPISVTLGQPQGDLIEIQSDALSAGDKLAASAITLLQAGQSVRPFEP